MVASSAWLLCCCSISTRVRNRLLMRETRCDKASCRRVAHSQVERAGDRRRSMNSPMVCRPARRDSPMSSMRRSTSSKYAALAEKREWVLAYWLSTCPASLVNRSSNWGSSCRPATRIESASSASSRSAKASTAEASRAAGRPSSAAMR
jgi:hypothetical protein